MRVILAQGHAHLPCIVPILTDDPRRESNDRFCRCRLLLLLLLLLLLPAACCLLQQAAPAATVAAATAAEDHCLPLADCRQLLPAPAVAYAGASRFGLGNTIARNKQIQVFYLGCCRTRPQTHLRISTAPTTSTLPRTPRMATSLRTSMTLRASMAPRTSTTPRLETGSCNWRLCPCKDVFQLAANVDWGHI